MTDDKIVSAMDDYAAINAHAAKIAAEKAAAIANVDVTDALAAGATVKIEGDGGGGIFSPGPTPYAKRETQHLAEREVGHAPTDKNGVPDFSKARPNGQNEIYGRIKRTTAWGPAAMATAGPIAGAASRSTVTATATKVHPFAVWCMSFPWRGICL